MSSVPLVLVNGPAAEFWMSRILSSIFGATSAFRRSSWLEIKAWISFSASFWFVKLVSEVLKKNVVLVYLLIWDLRLRSGSTTTLVTSDWIQGANFSSLKCCHCNCRGCVWKWNPARALVWKSSFFGGIYLPLLLLWRLAGLDTGIWVIGRHRQRPGTLYGIRYPGD